LLERHCEIGKPAALPRGADLAIGYCLEKVLTQSLAIEIRQADERESRKKNHHKNFEIRP
jgi:hypothetical protein